jgi:hypothetical protein
MVAACLIDLAIGALFLIAFLRTSPTAARRDWSGRLSSGRRDGSRSFAGPMRALPHEPDPITRYRDHPRAVAGEVNRHRSRPLALRRR